MIQPAAPRLLFLNQRKILFQWRVILNITTRLNAPSTSTFRPPSCPPGKTSITSYLHNKPLAGGIPNNAPTESKVCEPPCGSARASLFAAADGSGMDRLALRLQHALLSRAEGAGASWWIHVIRLTTHTQGTVWHAPRSGRGPFRKRRLPLWMSGSESPTDICSVFYFIWVDAECQRHVILLKPLFAGVSSLCLASKKKNKKSFRIRRSAKNSIVQKDQEWS